MDNQSKNTDRRPKTPKTYIDYAIFKGKIRLVSPDGQKVVERDEAIELAKSKGMNLVQIAYNKSEFPHAVCKIMDYGKFQYEQQKKEKEARRKSRMSGSDLKEVQFSIRIDSGDMNTKVEKIRSFLSEDREKVKVVIRRNRRETPLAWMAKNLMDEIVKKVSDVAAIDVPITENGLFTTCILKPAK